MPFSEKMYKDMIGEWNKTKTYIRVPLEAAAEATHADKTEVAAKDAVVVNSVVQSTEPVLAKKVA